MYLARILLSVDLPAPFSPNILNFSFIKIIETSSRATTPGNICYIFHFKIILSLSDTLAPPVYVKLRRLLLYLILIINIVS